MSTLEHFIEQAKKITDLQGTAIDAGILEFVAVLHAHGFETAGSCEGHAEHEGYSYPFVTIVTPEPEGYDPETFDHDDPDQCDAREDWLYRNLEQQEKLLRLLEAFYDQHQPQSLRAMLVMNTFGTGICNLRSYGAELMFMNGTYEQELPMFQAEMAAFKNFLKERL